MRDKKRLRIEEECGKLPLLFAKYADDSDYEAMAELFAEDCIYARPFQPGVEHRGRDTVRAMFRDRPPILVRHVVTNVLVDVLSDKEARGTNYVTMLSNHASTEPPQEAGGIYVGEFTDHYVKTKQGWKFQSRHGIIALTQSVPQPKAATKAAPKPAPKASATPRKATAKKGTK